MMCRYCLYDIALSSTDRWRLTWNPDNDAAPYECTENEAGHEPAGDTVASAVDNDDERPQPRRGSRDPRSAGVGAAGTTAAVGLVGEGTA